MVLVVVVAGGDCVVFVDGSRCGGLLWSVDDFYWLMMLLVDGWWLEFVILGVLMFVGIARLLTVVLDGMVWLWLLWCGWAYW